MLRTASVFASCPRVNLRERTGLKGAILHLNPTPSFRGPAQAALNFGPRLDREFLVNGYRDLMRELYKPRNIPANSQFLRTTGRKARDSNTRGRSSRPFSSPYGCSDSGTAGVSPTGASASPRCSGGLACFLWLLNLQSPVITSDAWRACFEGRIRHGSPDPGERQWSANDPYLGDPRQHARPLGPAGRHGQGSGGLPAEKGGTYSSKCVPS